MIIEIGTFVWFGRSEQPLEVVNIKINLSSGQEPTIYFSDGGDMPASVVYNNIRRVA